MADQGSSKHPSARSDDLLEAVRLMERPPEEIFDHFASAIDALNIVWKIRFGSALFRLTNVRPVSQLGKSCSSPEELSHRIQALSVLIDDMSIDARKYGTTLSPEQRRPINLLEQLLRAEAPYSKPSRVIDVLRRIRRLRHLFPAHADGTESVRALRDFGFSHPLREGDEQAVWHNVRVVFFVILQSLSRAAEPGGAFPGWLLESYAAADEGDWARCADVANRAIASQPDAVAEWRSPAWASAARALLGHALYRLGRLNEAVGPLRQAVKDYPDNAWAQHGLGVALGTMGNWEEALQGFQEVVRVQPDADQAWYGLGQACAQTGRAEDALSAFREYTRLRPDDPNGHYNLGVFAAKAGMHAEALAAFEEAIRLDPSYANAHFGRGTTLAKLCRLEEAADAFREAIRLEPTFYRAYHNLAIALTGLQGDDEAAQVREIAVRLEPDNP